jgi:hypothetical protein
MTTKLIVAQECEEIIARQKSPLTKEMYAAMAKLASISDQDSAESVTFDWFNLIKYTGFRVAEYAQITQSKVDEFEYASGIKVVKAFFANNGNSMMMTITSLQYTCLMALPIHQRN